MNPNHAIFVVDPALKTCELDCFNQIMIRNPRVNFQYFAPALFGMNDLLNTPVIPRGIIILGSGASVYDDLGWQEPMNRWLMKQTMQNTPTLGICYGHQLLAYLYNGRIELGFNGDKKRGFRDISINNMPHGLQAGKGPVVVSHRECVVDPGEFDIVGSSELVEVEVISHPDKPIWGFQSHIEATPAFLANNSIDVVHTDGSFAFGHRQVDYFIRTAMSHDWPA